MICAQREPSPCTIHMWPCRKALSSLHDALSPWFRSQRELCASRTVDGEVHRRKAMSLPLPNPKVVGTQREPYSWVYEPKGGPATDHLSYYAVATSTPCLVPEIHPCTPVLNVWEVTRPTYAHTASCQRRLQGVLVGDVHTCQHP